LPREQAIVLVSGGMDSCVAAAIAACHHDLAFLHCTYGQRTARKEREAFEAIARHYGVERKMVADLPFLGQIGGSSLTDPAKDVEEGLSEPGVIPSTYVPFRNSLILSVAVAWAEATGVEKIFIGAVESDSSGYPDCRKAYYEAFNRLAKLGTRSGRVAVIAPLVEMDKCEIVRKGLELEAPLHLTWSCYVRNDVACGACESCLLRRGGFRNAGAVDAIPYLGDT